MRVAWNRRSLFSFPPTSNIEYASYACVGVGGLSTFFLKIRSSSRALKRLKKSGTSDGNDSDNGGRDTDRSNTNSERNRREHEEEVGSNRSSSTRRSGEVGYTNAEHGGANNNQGSSGSSRRRDWDSKRSLSRSRSSSPSTLFDRLKVNWGREGWQDFELLRNNVPGPGTKGYAGPGASQGKSECPSVVGLIVLLFLTSHRMYIW